MATLIQLALPAKYGLRGINSYRYFLSYAWLYSIFFFLIIIIGSIDNFNLILKRKSIYTIIVAQVL